MDTKTANQVLDVFRSMNRFWRNKSQLRMIEYCGKVDRVVAIRDGRTSSEFIRRKSYVENWRR